MLQQQREGDHQQSAGPGDKQLQEPCRRVSREVPGTAGKPHPHLNLRRHSPPKLRRVPRGVLYTRGFITSECTCSYFVGVLTPMLISWESHIMINRMRLTDQHWQVRHVTHPTSHKSESFALCHRLKRLRGLREKK